MKSPNNYCHLLTCLILGLAGGFAVRHASPRR